MIGLQVDPPTAEAAPRALLWVPAWVVVLVGTAVVLGGVVHFVRRIRRRSGSERAGRTPLAGRRSSSGSRT